MQARTIWLVKPLWSNYLLFVMELATRHVHFAGCTPKSNESWRKQIGKNLTDAREQDMPLDFQALSELCDGEPASL